MKVFQIIFTFLNVYYAHDLVKKDQYFANQFIKRIIFLPPFSQINISYQNLLEKANLARQIIVSQYFFILARLRPKKV